ncbi:hypothetical protein K9L27_01070 [Candidatus Gracilibacteria bacterium]|nr:hypothetical protein [Candidatus Gracilibacteria bacterium]
MKKILFGFGIIAVLGLTILIIRGLSSEDTWIQENDEWVRHGNPDAPKPDELFTKVETLNQSCTRDEDCQTPPQYLMRSNCPYTSKCLKEKCTVICPFPWKHFESKNCPPDTWKDIVFDNPSEKFLSPEEIGEELWIRWIQLFKNGGCSNEQLKDFHIQQVSRFEEFTPLEGFFVTITFDVFPEEISSSLWQTESGKKNEDGWIRDKFLFWNIVKQGTEYHVISSSEHIDRGSLQ